MERIFSTDAVHPRDRFDYWHEVACKTIIIHDSRPDCRPKFEAEIESGRLADIGLVRFTNSPIAVSYTTHHVPQTRSDDLFLCRQIAGSLMVEQEGHEAALQAGDMTLLDPRLPYTGRFSAQSNLLLVKLPRHALEARIGRVRCMAARAMTSLDPATSLASTFVAALPGQCDGSCPATEELLKAHTLDLVAMSLSRLMGDETPPTSSTRALALLRVHAVVESRLSDRRLDPNMVAAAAGISVRYANALLSEQSTSLGRLIQARRLERCRRALEDPRQAYRSVSEIAYGWGFSDMTHFGRRFRKAYGMLPSEARRSQTPSS